MINRLSEGIGAFLVSHGLPKENKEVYAYGAECLINVFICDFFLLLWAAYCSCVAEALVWIVSFTLLRSHLGGYHAKTHAQCIVSSILLGIVSVEVRGLWLINIQSSVNLSLG